MFSRSALLIVGLALFAAIAGLLAGRWWFTPAAPEHAAIGTQRPALTLADLDGRTQSIAQFDGRPLLVNFWATWCAPCVEELPRLDAAHARRDRDGIAVLAIALEDDPAAVRAFAQRLQLALPVWLDPPQRDDASVRYGNTRGVLPYSVLIGADGTIVQTRMGALDAEELRALIARAAASAEKKPDAEDAE